MKLQDLAPQSCLLAIYVLRGVKLCLKIIILCFLPPALALLFASYLEWEVAGYLAARAGPQRGQPVPQEKPST